MLAFIHIEKAAGITINHIMRREFGLSHCDVEPWRRDNDYFSQQDFRRLRLLYPHLKSIAGHRVKPYSDLREICPDIRYYTTLREPIARCASHYQFQIQRMGRSVPFEEWIEEDRFRNFQVKKLVGRDDIEAAIAQLEEGLFFVGLMESFDESLVLLRDKVKDFCDLDVSYLRYNIAADNSIKNQILSDPQSKAALVEANKLDIELYEYAKQQLYQRQKSAYGDTLEADVAAFKAANAVNSVRIGERMNWLKRNLFYKPALSAYRRMVSR